MKPFLLKLPLQRKEPELCFEVCEVDHIVELSDREFSAFQQNLLADYDFLQEFNRKFAGKSADGVRIGVLILGEGYDDGILVCTEGYNYARYSACVSNARQWLLLEQYPTLRAYAKDMADLAGSYIRKAVAVGLPGEYRFPLQESRSHFNGGDSFNDSLFLDMLCDRPELDDLVIDGNNVQLKLNPAYLPQPTQMLRTISADDFKVACAKHLLWIYGAGGEPADFSNCVFDGIDFSNMELNSAVFDGAQFKSCDLSDASLCYASFKGCTFVGCSCRSWTAEEAIFQEAVFEHCCLNNAVMTHSDFTDAVFQDCEMEYASIQNCLTQNMRLEDVCTGTLNQTGTTEDAAQWFHDATPRLSMEELK